MKILLVAATQAELQFFREDYAGKVLHELEYLYTGVGLIPATFQLTKELQYKKYDLVIHAGIAGAFKRELLPGTVVIVNSDLVYNEGAEDGAEFLDLYKLGLKDKNEFPYKEGRLINPNPIIPLKLKQADSISVFLTHGDEESIQKAINRHNPDIETMEGAAVSFVCLNLGQPFIHIRAISNFVEKRNRSAWEIPKALKELARELYEIILNLDGSGI